MKKKKLKIGISAFWRQRVYLPSKVICGVASNACQERTNPVFRSGRDMYASFHTWKHLPQS